MDPILFLVQVIGQKTGEDLLVVLRNSNELKWTEFPPGHIYLFTPEHLVACHNEDAHLQDDRTVTDAEDLVRWYRDEKKWRVLEQ